MRALRILAVIGVLVALTAIAPVVSAGTDKGFYLDKTCAADASEPLGYVCTVQHSGFKWITPGTKIHYAAISGFDPDDVVAATITIANGSTTGVCDWRYPVGPVLAVCTFDGGTGRLTEFQLVVDVTVDAQDVWYWNGVYSFGG